jgi:lipopolysaccharide biosynthesis glycosyltransferase
MRKIIFSVWSDLDQNWSAHKNIIVSKQKEYARACNAEYNHFVVDHNFTDLMFFKILKAEELTKEYDKVLYLDCDVVPKTEKSFFNSHDFDKICLHRTQKPDWKIQHKQMMLHMDNIQGNDLICNTGVFGISKKSAEALMFSERLDDTKKLSEVINNEICISYMIERYNVPLKDIGMQWNFILDRNFKEESAACYFIHYSNKIFPFEP